MAVTRSSRTRSIIVLLTMVVLLLPMGARAQEVPPPAPVAPGLPEPVPASSTATGGKGRNGLTLQTLSTATMDPTAIAVAPDGRVIFAERQGAIKVITRRGETIEAGRLLVNATGCAGCPDQTLEEGGIHGLEVSPKFAKDRKLYVYYSVPFSVGVGGFGPNEAVFRLSTFVLTKDNTLVTDSEKVLLRNPAGTLACCHYGGDIDFLPDGTLTLTVGDDTSPRVEGFNPRDNRPGFEEYNAERTAQNRADRRGKVLRLLPNGGVPNGRQRGIRANPFVGNRKYDPYIYAMGFRSNYRAANDPVTGSVFVGNVGPDASADDPNRGPRGYDELETILRGGGSNHGWPRCIGNNIPYRRYDYVTRASGPPMSCKGFTPATMWYPYGKSDRFPQLGSDGGRTAIAGTVYRYKGRGRFRFPDRFQGQLLFMEWSRNKVWSMPVIDERRNGRRVRGYGKVRPSEMRLVAEGLFHPIDAAVGPDGAVYIAEYGNGFYGNGNSRISRLVPKTAGTATAAGQEATVQSAGVNLRLPGGAAAAAVLALLIAIAIRRRSAVV